MPFPSEPITVLLQAHAPEASVLTLESIIHSNIVNFGIALVALIVILRRLNLPGLIGQRQQTIVIRLKEAEAQRDKALSDLAGIEQRSAQLAQDVAGILAEARQTAETVAQSIVQNAEEDARKILEQAQRRAEQERSTAARELEQRLMREALHAAQELLENTLNDTDRHRSVEEFVTRLPQLAQQEALR